MIIIKLRHIILICLFILITQINSIAQSHKPINNNNQQRYSQDMIDAYSQQMRPLVESICDRKFIAIPQIKLSNTADIVLDIASELEVQLQAVYPSMTNRQCRKKAVDIAKSIAPITLAKYGLKSQKIFLITKNIYYALKEIELSDTDEDVIVKLLIAHELTHALQCQEIQQKHKILFSSSIDSIMAKKATFEGHAMFVQEKIAINQNQEIPLRYLENIMSAIDLKHNDILNSMSNNIEHETNMDCYFAGKVFMEWHYNIGGSELLWKILKHPPNTTSDILHPEQFKVNEAVGDVEHMLKLSSAVDLFQGQQWITKRNERIGEVSIRSAYANLPETVKDPLIHNINNGEMMVQSNEKHLVGVTLYSLNDERRMQSSLESIEQLTMQRIASIQPLNAPVASDIIFADNENAKCKYAREINYSMSSDQGTNEYQVIRIIANGYMLEVNSINYPLSYDILTKLIKFTLADFKK